MAVIIISTQVSCAKYKPGMAIEGTFRPNGCVEIAGFASSNKERSITVQVCQPVPVIEIGTFVYNPLTGVGFEVGRVEFSDGGLFVSTASLRLAGQFEYVQRHWTMGDWVRHHPIKTTMFTLLFLVIVIGFAAVAVTLRNEILSADQQVQERRAMLIGGLQKRFDLIRSLWALVFGFQGRERDVIRATLAAYLRSTEKLSVTKGLLIIKDLSMRFPSLSAGQHYMELMRQLPGIENDLEAKFADYNRAARAFNEKLKTLTGGFLNSSLLNLRDAPFLSLAQADVLFPQQLKLPSLGP